MINLIDITPWVDLIKDNCPSFGGRVFETIPDDELIIDAHQSPVAFVYLSDDSSNDNQSAGNTVIQRTASQVTVEIAMRRTASRNDKFNGAAVALIRQYRTEVFEALIGQRLGNCIKPIRHVNGQLNKKEPKVLKWDDIFTTDNIITS